ncbi:MAG: Efflux transporter, RND family, MFP subunit [Candidatus Collierbacteria bacterium GW2011_GWB1_44_6]|uniref:Efflux transporter, RND family, MFP subunit n=2 Tax=Candidatus Collieribacteriota TaxID=1752725 RepID=A0A0G1JPC9_9BACT|nr:MAG: Efflux transporter, RND family, MFP subunit [Candidatus Collierbacteria bacterium GW2011_GWC2_43_12]KKT73406.1 MAG: Efflux transporter, RND family, MFP subunit [Candidatus Collierbacteria bacterium GW2011_GWB1_44_6]KKT82899.1 MAG: Periplasmic component of efflux system [Microgenomates group bacterium GW2011_GWC1_44_9]
MNTIRKISTLIKSHRLISSLLLLVIVGGSSYWYLTSKKSGTLQYVTSIAEKGLLVSSITASGTITSGDTTYVTTGATGTVSKVFIKNGDTVKKDQKMAEINLDDDGKLNQTIAWNNYQTAQVTAKNSLTSKQTSEITMLQRQQALADAETAQRDSISGGWNPDTKRPYTQNELDIVAKEYPQAKEAYDAAIKSFQIADSNIAVSQAKSLAAYRNYQKVSSTVYAPADGVVNNLVLAPGVVLSSTNGSGSITVSTGTDSTTNSSSVTSQKIGAIKNPEGKYQATVSLTEVDVTKVQSGQKVSITMDAFPDTTLTGTVLAVNTSGSVSSGVTSYSASILLDPTTLNIYTNMALNAEIIVASTDDTVIIPSSAIQTKNNQLLVEILKDGKVSTVTVEVGLSNDTQTAIKSGVNEGDSVVTSTSTGNTKTTTGSSTSVFGNPGGGFRMQL